MSLFDFLDFWQIIKKLRTKFPFPYNILFSLIIAFFILLYLLNKEFLEKQVEAYHEIFNYILITELLFVFLFLSLYYILNRKGNIQTSAKKIVSLLIIILLLPPIIFIFYYNFYLEPPKDRLVVAISPFYYTDISGQSGLDINTANDFKEKLEEQKNLGLKIIMLDNPIRNADDAKSQGKINRAHLVVYGETKKKIGGIEEIKYYILPLSSLEINYSEISSLYIITEDSISIISGKATFSMVTEKPIQLIESLKENASSAIYAIGAFEKYKKLNFTSATTFFKSIKNYENNSLILVYIANCYYFSNDLNESLQYFDKAIEINLQFAEAWNNKGAVLDKLSRYEEALAAYDKAIKINLQDANAWNNKGVTLNNLGRYEEALAAYDKAIGINPQHAIAWYNKGVTLDYMGRYGEALVAYDNATGINPQHANAWTNKGATLDSLGRYAEALVAYNNATRINPQHATAWSNKGAAFGKLGRYKEALAASNRAIEINPEHENAWYNKGLALLKLSRYEDALVASDRATKINPQNAKAWNNKGLALGKLGRYEEALGAFDKATEINPKFADAWTNKGAALDNLGNYEEALKALDKALEIDPRNANAWNNKGFALNKLGRTEEGKEALDRAYELDPSLKVPTTSGFEFIIGICMVFAAGYFLKKRF